MTDRVNQENEINPDKFNPILVNGKKIPMNQVTHFKMPSSEKKFLMIQKNRCGIQARVTDRDDPVEYFII